MTAPQLIIATLFNRQMKILMLAFCLTLCGNAYACQIYLDWYHVVNNRDTLETGIWMSDTIRDRLARYLPLLGHEVETTSAFFAPDSSDFDVIFVFCDGMPYDDIEKFQHFAYDGGLLITNGEYAIHSRPLVPHPVIRTLRYQLEHFLTFPGWNLEMLPRWDKIIDTVAPWSCGDYLVLNFLVHPFTYSIDTLYGRYGPSIQFSYPAIPLGWACSLAFSADADSLEVGVPFTDPDILIVPSAPVVMTLQTFGRGAVLLIADCTIWIPNENWHWPWDTFDVEILMENVFGWCDWWNPQFNETPQEGVKIICPENNEFAFAFSGIGPIDTTALWIQLFDLEYHFPCEELAILDDTTVSFTPYLDFVSDSFYICLRDIRDTSAVWIFDSICFVYIADFEDITHPQLDSLHPDPHYAVDSLDSIIFYFREPESEIDTSSIWISIDDTAFYSIGDSEVVWLDDSSLLFYIEVPPPLCTTYVEILRLYFKLANRLEYCVPETLDTCIAYAIYCSGIKEIVKNIETPLLLLNNNPVHQSLAGYYELGNASRGELDILDITGKTVFSTRLDDSLRGTFNIDLSDVPSGVYLVVLSAGKEKTAEKIIKF